MSKPVTKSGPVAVQSAGQVMPDTAEAVPAPVPSASLISQVMAEMGRRGGRIGGKRLETLTPRRRRQLARLAALARWSKKKQQREPQL
jgi:hypothetical protein